jgi:ABC-type transporter Mla MlaB component
VAADQSGSNTVALSGPVTLYESSGVRDTLVAALEEGKNLQINLEASGPWDVAGMQVLIAAVASGRKAGLNVRFLHVPGVCREVAERSGLFTWLTGVTDSFA